MKKELLNTYQRICMVSTHFFDEFIIAVGIEGIQKANISHGKYFTSVSVYSIIETQQPKQHKNNDLIDEELLIIELWGDLNGHEKYLLKKRYLKIIS